MTVNFKSGSSDFDDVFIQRSYTTLDDVNVPGSLWSWGRNQYGQLGQTNTIDKPSPVQIGSLSSWKQIDCGEYHTILTQTDGSLWTWGYNGYGQLGLGNTTPRSSPVQVGSLTNWKQISSNGYSHTSAIKTDGTLWSWGYNYRGNLGLGDTTHRSSPVQVGSLTNWKQVSSGGQHKLGIKTDGTLWAWGSNDPDGRLGLGNTTPRSSPVQVGSLTNWKQVNGGENYSLAVKTDGSLWAWGSNTYGQLGLNDITSYSSPVQVGTLTNWKLVSGGRFHSIAIKTDGTLWAWGHNGNGQLGLGDITHRSSPVQVGSLTNWKSISSGSWYHSIAIKTDGTLWNWGNNSNGQSGLGDTVHRSSPVQVGSLTNWKSVSGGNAHSVAIQSNL